MSGVRRACLSFVVPYRGCRHGKIQTEKFPASPIAWCLCTAGMVIAVCWQQFSSWFFGYWEIWLSLLCCSVLLWNSIIQTVTQLERGRGVGISAAWNNLAQVNLKPHGLEKTGNTSCILWGGCNDLATHVRDKAKAFPRHWQKYWKAEFTPSCSSSLLWLFCSGGFFAKAIFCLAFLLPFLLPDVVLVVHVNDTGHLFYGPIWKLNWCMSKSEPGWAPHKYSSLTVSPRSCCYINALFPQNAFLFSLQLSLIFSLREQGLVVPCE